MDFFSVSGSGGICCQSSFRADLRVPLQEEVTCNNEESQASFFSEVSCPPWSHRRQPRRHPVEAEAVTQCHTCPGLRTPGLAPSLRIAGSFDGNLLSSIPPSEDPFRYATRPDSAAQISPKREFDVFSSYQAGCTVAARSY